MKLITITADSVSLVAELNENPTAQKIWEALPIEGRANTWGDEIYFEIRSGRARSRRPGRKLRWGS